MQIAKGGVELLHTCHGYPKEEVNVELEGGLMYES